MSYQGWTVFALFWLVFVTTPGPNAVNCITNGMTIGFGRSLWGVLAILTQATLFLSLSAAGVTALIATSPVVFQVAKMIGARFLIYLGVRGWMLARRPFRSGMPRAARSIGGPLRLPRSTPRVSRAISRHSASSCSPMCRLERRCG